MVATYSILAVLAATATLASASRYGDHQNGDWEHSTQPDEKENVEHHFGHADIPDYGDHYQKEHYTVYSPQTSAYSAAKSSAYAKASSASFKPYFPSYRSSQYVASWATPSVVSKRATASSKFIDPFASSTKGAGGAFIVPVVVATPVSPSAKTTPAPSRGFSTLVAGNATAARTTLSLFNACTGSNATCASQKEVTYLASVVTANPAATVFAIDCSQRGRNGSTVCFPDAAMTVTQGSSMFARVDEPRTVSCDIISRTVSAVCTESSRAVVSAAASGYAPRSSGNATAAVVGESFSFGREQIYYNELVVTAGGEKLAASRTPVAPSASATAAAAASGLASSNGVPAAGVNAASFAGVAAVVFAVLAM